MRYCMLHMHPWYSSETEIETEMRSAHMNMCNVCCVHRIKCIKRTRCYQNRGELKEKSAHNNDDDDEKRKRRYKIKAPKKVWKKKKTIKHKTSTRPKHLNGKWFGCFSHWQWPLRFFNVNRMATNNFYVRHVKRMASTDISQTGIELKARREREKAREQQRKKKQALARTHNANWVFKPNKNWAPVWRQRTKK